jgi:hypothetical protein
MSIRPTKLIGRTLSDFNELVKSGEQIHLQTAGMASKQKKKNKTADSSSEDTN